MPNKIKPKRSYTANSVPLTTDLEPHELAINWVDGKAFTKDASGNIVSVTLGGSGGGGSTSLPSTINGSLAVDGDTNFGSVSLLLNGDDLIDRSSSPKTVNVIGNVTATGSAKFGTNSLSFPGGYNFLTVNSNPAFSFPGDFTVETWVRLDALSSSYSGAYGVAIVSTYASISGNAGWQLRINGTASGFDTINVYTGLTDLNWSYPFALNTWYHVAVTRSGTNLRVWVNGTQVGATVTNSENWTPNANNDLWIGRLNAGVYEFPLNGLIDDLRITKGVARYTTSFTPPTAALPTFASYTLSSVSLAVSGGSGSGGGSGLTWSSVPASATASGTAGQIAYDGSYFYLATGSSQWVRAALSTWTPFTPASVTGLQLWLDASDASSLYDATSGGSLVAADGAVARWEDKSGNGRHATQATSGDRPARKTAVYGGKDALRFDGSSDWMSVSGSASSLKCLHDGDSTLFLVIKVGASSNPGHGRYTLLSNVRDGSSVRVGVEINHRDSDPSTENDLLDVNVFKGLGGNYPVYSANNNFFASGSVGVISAVFKPSDATAANRVSLRRNGGVAVTANTPAGADQAVSTANADQDLNISRRPGYAYAADGFVNGDYCEIIVYDAALSDTDRAAVESYLMTKWGIS